MKVPRVLFSYKKIDYLTGSESDREINAVILYDRATEIIYAQDYAEYIKVIKNCYRDLKGVTILDVQLIEVQKDINSFNTKPVFDFII